MVFPIAGRGCFGEFGKDVTSLLEFVKQVLAGKDRQRTNNRHDFIDHNNNIDIADLMGAKYNRISELAKCGVKTSKEALVEAGLTEFDDGNRIGIFMGTADGCEIALHKFYKSLKDNGYKKGNPLLFPETALNVPASYISIAHKITGPIVSVASGFTAGYEAIETAMNYLNYGAIDYAVIVCAEEVNEFLLWKAHNQSLMRTNSNKVDMFNERQGNITGRASCLVIKRGDGGEGKGTIRSLGISNVCSGNSVISAIDAAIKRADISLNDVHLVIRQVNDEKLASTEEDYLREILPAGVPVINSEKLFGEQFGDSTLLSIIWATLIRQFPGTFEEYLVRDHGLKCLSGFQASVRTILITSLSPVGKYGALLIHI